MLRNDIKYFYVFNVYFEIMKKTEYIINKLGHKKQN